MGERLAALQRELPAAEGYQCDVTNDAQLNATIEAVGLDHGSPGVLIHNAVGAYSQTF